MEIIYIQLDNEAIVDRLSQGSQEDLEDSKDQADSLEAGQLPFDPEIPLPYIIRQKNELNADEYEPDSAAELDWNGIVDGILYIALYEPKHEHRNYYKDFLLRLEPELPHILRERLRDQYDERLWAHARDTVGILLFLLPEANWPLLELGYLYEQEAENALLEQRFAACGEAWNLAALSYQQLLQRDEMNAKCYFQLGYYYLQCWNFLAAYQAFISSQQLALSPEHPLWGKCHSWLQRLNLFDFTNAGSEEAKVMGLRWGRILEDLQRALRAGSPDANLQTGADPQAEEILDDGLQDELEIMGHRGLWLVPLSGIDELLQDHPDSGMLWYLRALCLLYGGDVSSLADDDLATESWAGGPPGAHGHGINRCGVNSRGASWALNKARELGWATPLEWQLPYYLGLSYYLEGQYREAEKSFLQVLQLDTEHCATLYWLEKLYSDLEDPRSYQYQGLLTALYAQFPNLIEYFV